MTMRPLHDGSQGAPWRVGEYVVTQRYIPDRRPRHSYVIYMLSGYNLGHRGQGFELFECTTKREAEKHVRMLERGRVRLLREIAHVRQLARFTGPRATPSGKLI